MWSFLVELDATTSATLSVCANARNPLQKLCRLFFKLVEYSGHGLFWISFCLFLYYNTSDNGARFVISELLIGILVDLVIQCAIKLAVRRRRPIYNNADMRLTVMAVDSYSFPSGHATRFGFLFVFVRFYFPGTFERTVIGVWTLMIACSRLLLGRHYVSDVVCGFVIGCLEFQFVHQYAGLLIQRTR
ncbi:polyisoprenoid diphosphate/phosphate phosphohydrolase PLPP6-like [Corticium candelabrum]|uniref:polyisoprenoid diphosphate/phosphate phosphohydrolase PLPP6-like n=1 Tax=Corticium candelabrum TaxID=121492 RepID=UPI002E268B4B|nr:polyisoprenoid diphosphate/phosphate phosphohydrolase PLPP6-like [Corticium candelabrum]